MNPVSLFDMEAMAKLRMSHNHWDYVAGGAADEITLRRNRTAFDEITLNPRFLVDVSEADLSTTVLGDRISFPVMASAAGSMWEAHPEGEVAVAKGAGQAGTLMALATGSSRSIAEVAEAATGPLWYQLYHMDDEVTEFQLDLANQAGFSAICLTVDGLGGRPKERDIRNDYQPQAEKAWADLHGRPDLQEKVTRQREQRHQGLTWSRLEWLRSLTGLPLVVKGILTPEDARLCVEHGVDGIVVSNHGGRTLDTSQASIEALPPIAEAVGNRVELYLDSGVRRGTDVVKALALGARAVLVGRPLFWGLAIDGHNGVATMFEILRTEFDKAMAYTGLNKVDQIGRNLVTTPDERYGNRSAAARGR